MTKTKSHALWNELTPEQRETLDGWRFEENSGYTEILTRAQNEMGFKGQMSSLKRYFARRRQERLLAKQEEMRAQALEITAGATAPDALREASMKMLQGQLFQLLHEAPENVQAWAPVANAMMRNEYNDTVRELNKIRREAMELTREKFHADIIEKALKALPELKELEQARKDPQTKHYEERARWNQLRRTMFGPGFEVYPESAQEEAEVRSAMRASGAPEAETTMITDAQPPGPSSQYYQEYVEAQAKRGQEEAEKNEGKND